MHKHLKKTRINTYGLVYEWTGTDKELKPFMLAGHQGQNHISRPIIVRSPPMTLTSHTSCLQQTPSPSSEARSTSGSSLPSAANTSVHASSASALPYSLARFADFPPLLSRSTATSGVEAPATTSLVRSGSCPRLRRCSSKGSFPGERSSLRPASMRKGPDLEEQARLGPSSRRRTARMGSP